MSDVYIPLNPFMGVIHLIALNPDGTIALIKRSNTGRLDNLWCLPTGSIEPGESPQRAAVREAAEEIGIEVHDLTLGTVIAYRDASYDDATKAFQSLELFFVATSWTGDIHNAEPHKHSDLMLAHADRLPEPMIPVVAYGIAQWRVGNAYAELWKK